MIPNIEEIKSWFSPEDDSEDYYELENTLIDLPMYDAGHVFELPGVTDFQLQIEHTNINREYDSYGYRSLDDGYIVFSVTGIDGSSANFKIPYYYASYEGWSWDISKISQVEKREKVVTTWEWTDV